MVGPARTYEAAGELLKVLGAPARLGIVACLEQRPCNVGELASVLELSQPLASQHLRVLRAARLVEVDRRGREAVYSLADDHVAHIVGNAITHSRELRMSTQHDSHDGHDHEHGPDCGHEAVTHDDHTDHIHDGHAHAAHDGHWDEH